MRLIGLSGYKTAGKDATYEAIRDALVDKHVERVALGDKVKELCGLALGLRGSPEDIISQINTAKKNGRLCYSSEYPVEGEGFGGELSMRSFVQNLGHGTRVAITPDFWVNMVLPFSSALLDVNYPAVDVLVVTDIRYPNEAERIIALGGEMWCITRPGLTTDGHDSEKPLPDSLIGLHIVNNSTLKKLNEAVKKALCHV